MGSTSLNSGESVANCAEKLGINRNTLSGWVTAHHEQLKEDATEEPLSFAERARLKELEKQVKELKMENEFLLKASAFFAKLQR